MGERLDSGQLKKMEFRLLCDFDAYCRKHSLTYWLTYGTLIGACRHQGFIPWDDDIDVMMPREDFDRLFALVRNDEIGEHTKLVSHATDRKYYPPQGKLIDTTTVLKEHVAPDYEMGVNIDIFPLENLADDSEEAKKRIRKAYWYNHILQVKTVRWNRKRSLARNMMLVAAKLVFLGWPISSVLNRLDSFCCATKNRDTMKYVGVMSGITAGDETRVFERKWFESSQNVMFEGKSFPAPRGADALLSRIYGDYMQLPPESERITHHDFEAWRTENKEDEGEKDK